MTSKQQFASPVDTERWGQYRILRSPADTRPLYRFTGRVSADGSSGFAAEAGRYHLYAGWFCPWSQRVIIQVALNGLADVIAVSYVDDERDGRGWAFRPRRGPDPVSGFVLLRQAYEATEAGFDGHISTPTLWDRHTGQVLSNDFATIGLDIATQFGRWGDQSVDSYPLQHRAEIAELDSWIGPDINHGVGTAIGDGDAAAQASARLLAAFACLDQRLATRRFLLGSAITEADIRLYVTLVRYPAQLTGRGAEFRLTSYPRLWAYLRDLYTHPAFACTTDFQSFGAPESAVSDWTEPNDRADLAPTRHLEASPS